MRMYQPYTMYRDIVLLSHMFSALSRWNLGIIK